MQSILAPVGDLGVYLLDAPLLATPLSLCQRRLQIAVEAFLRQFSAVAACGNSLEAEINSDLISAEKYLPLDGTDEIAIPAPLGVLGEVPGFDAPFYRTMLPHPKATATQHDSARLKHDVLVGERHPAEQPAAAPAQLGLTVCISFVNEFVNDFLDHLGWQSNLFARTLGQIAQLRFSNPLRPAFRRLGTDLVCEIPDDVDGFCPTREVLSAARVFHAVAERLVNE